MRLRIEDTDRERSTDEAVKVIFDALKWLGLEWSGEVAYQSKRTDKYHTAIEKLLADGNAYHCFCSRESAWMKFAKHNAPPGKNRVYDGKCRDSGQRRGGR